MTHRFQNNYTKEFLAKLRKFYGLQQISQPEDLAKGLRTPREFDFRGKWDFYRTSTGLRKQTLGGHKQNLVCTRGQEKGAVTPQETDPDLPVNVQEWRHGSTHGGNTA